MNMSGLSYIDPAGVNVIHAVASEFSDIQINFYLASCSSPIFEMIKKCEMYTYKELSFKIFATIEDAVSYSRSALLSRWPYNTLYLIIYQYIILEWNFKKYYFCIILQLSSNNERSNHVYYAHVNITNQFQLIIKNISLYLYFLSCGIKMTNVHLYLNSTLPMLSLIMYIIYMTVIQ